MRICGPAIAAVWLVTLNGNAEDKKSSVGDEVKRLQGTWLLMAQIFEGNPLKDDSAPELVIDGQTLTHKSADGSVEKISFTVDPTNSPKTMDFVLKKMSEKSVVAGEAVYELDGDTLKVCVGKPRPSEVTDEKQPLLIYKREKGKAPVKI